MKQHRMRIKSTGLFFLLCFWLLFVFPSYAMDAPGSGGKNWSYGKDHHWTYRDQDGQLHTSWLYYEGEWYWFDEHGWMQTGGTRTIDGIRYFFFSNGHMAHNQYVDLKFLGEDGQEDKKGEIRVIGTRKPDSEDKDLITKRTDALMAAAQKIGEKLNQQQAQPGAQQEAPKSQKKDDDVVDADFKEV